MPQPEITLQSPTGIDGDARQTRSFTRSKSNPVQFVRSLWRILRGRPQVPPSLTHHPLLDVIMKRRSMRSFTQREIPEDVFAAILEAGRLAPSTVNLQSWSFATFTAATWRATFDRPLPFQGQRAIIVMATPIAIVWSSTLFRSRR